MAMTDRLRNGSVMWCAALGITIAGLFAWAPSASAALTLTGGANATTTPSVATSITGFQIVGPAASTTPVKIHVTSGTVHVSATDGLTVSGNGTATLNLSGTVEDLNAALSTLTYTRGSTGTDTLEVALVNSTEVFFPDNDHLYKFVSGSYTWDEAKAAASSTIAYGARGYLATITSSDENSFVYTRISGDGWLAATDQYTEKRWVWDAGPEAGTYFFQENLSGGGANAEGGYNSWASGEPNDYNGGEDCGYMYASQNGHWNDYPCSTSQGYVVEFGAEGDLPSIVAKDISIVTADVPAVTSLSPANGAGDVSTAANLVIGFSKNVTAGTGDILIKKDADDSTAESIDVAGDQVTGGGTKSITIDPSDALAEGVTYYVLIPDTAFKDSSDNYYGGISARTTWAFTTADETAPSITALGATSTATTSSDIVWTTNEPASSRIAYSADTTYSSHTSESDTGTRVTDHRVALSGLVGCTNYHYKAVSADAAGNYATSSAAAFTTAGCPGGAEPSAATSTQVVVSSTSSAALTNTDRTFTVDTPADFTATSSSVIIQIKSMPTYPVLGSIGTPSADLSSAASIVFDVTALIDNTTVLDSFDAPVTITYRYTDADIEGLDENTLTMYHYHDGAWLPLDNCSVDTGANTISCSASSFSTFAIFGLPLAPVSGSAHRTPGTSIQSRVMNLISLGKTDEADALKDEWYWLFPQTARAESASSSLSVRDLELGMTGEDVRALQRLLNANGFTLAASGAGAPGSETDYFGALTRAAVTAYQKANGVAPTVGYFGPLTRASMTAAGLSGRWW
jgi:peptidoglycan hydrolase-like protein with peptidoglycan-binding domain